MTVYVIKLVSGEEIIGELPSGQNIGKGVAEYTIKNPVQLGMVDRDQMAFIKYLPYADTSNGLKIDSSRIMFMAPLAAELLQPYQSATSQVLTPPPKKLVLTP